MILDTVWMVVCPDNKGVIYQVGSSAKEVWQKIVDDETMGTGVTKEDLQKRALFIVLRISEKKLDGLSWFVHILATGPGGLVRKGKDENRDKRALRDC